MPLTLSSWYAYWEIADAASHNPHKIKLSILFSTFIKQSIDALFAVPVESRDITSMTMAIDKNKIPEAKRKIKQFRRNLCQFLESGEKNEVYNLNVQLIPLTDNNGELQ